MSDEQKWKGGEGGDVVADSDSDSDSNSDSGSESDSASDLECF